MSNKKNKKVFAITLTAIMSALATVIYMVFPEISIIPGASYLKLDFSDFPAILTGIAFSPAYGVMVEVVKNLVHLTRTTTLGIGDLMNTVIGSGLVLSMSLTTRVFAKLFKKKRFSLSVYAVSGIVSIIITIILGWISNMLLTPIFFILMNIPFNSVVYWSGVTGSTALNAVKALFNILPFYPVYLLSEKAVKKYSA